MKKIFLFQLFLILVNPFVYPQQREDFYKIIESNLNYIELEFNFPDNYLLKDTLINGQQFTYIESDEIPLGIPGDPYIPTRLLKLGLPPNALPEIKVLKSELEIYNNKFIISIPDSINQPLDILNYNENIYGINQYFPLQPILSSETAFYRFIKFTNLIISPFQFNPVERKLIKYKKLTARINYIKESNNQDIFEPLDDKKTNQFISEGLINSEIALNFRAKRIDNFQNPLVEYWYNPNKEYYKLFLNKKGVYRITYQDLINAGINPNGGISEGRFELYNYGENIPLDIIDSDSNGVFNEGDYFQFVGFPLKPSPYSGLNIYNLSNVYWLSLQADSVNRYKYKNGFPDNTFNLITSSISTIHWEEDKIYFQFGYSNNNQLDYWNWETIEVRNGQVINFFDMFFKDSIAYFRDPTKSEAKLRVSLNGVSFSPCPTAHNAWVKWNFTKIGPTVTWSGQTRAMIESSFYWGVGGDSVYCSPDSNYIIVGLDTANCAGNLDIVRLNWIELDYWRLHNMFQKPYFDFKSPPNRFGANNYFLFRYPYQSMKIYIPSRADLINNPWIRGDVDQGVYFRDTIYQQTEYFCVSPDYYLTVDSILKDKPSDLHNLLNGADYIIITHELFKTAAERLKSYRENNLFGFDSARVALIEVQDIYDEFNFGLMDPSAIKSFISFAFNNWQQPSPSYIVLVGDMSHDYRKILPDSRDNFIPAIPFQALRYGQVATDNEFVTIIGNDFIPDLAIGRISCETIEEANLLIDKIINYPGDPDKLWKKTIGLFSGGLDENDENTLRFNDRSMDLENLFVKPHGSLTTKVFRYPNKPEYIPFYGSGPEIRREINKGTVISNYYGHGGGYQWDFVFTDDDIYALNNDNRLPFVVSVTCYTNHFDNQEVFAEIFNSLPYGGSIAFLGSIGLTYWPTTAFFNQEMFREIFINKKYVLGDVIQIAKSNPAYGQMLQMLNLLGDPALRLALPDYPDFSIQSKDVTITPNNPLLNDTVNVSIKLTNFGTAFPNDSVSVELYEGNISDSTLIGMARRASFGFIDSVNFIWIPKTPGVIPLIVRLNEIDSITETDHSDNITTKNFAVFSIAEPNVLKPIDYFSSNEGSVDFIIVDIGEYINKDLSYRIVIDTSLTLNSTSQISSGILLSQEGIVKWTSPQLQAGNYFWKAFIYSVDDTNATSIRTFSINNSDKHQFNANGNQLQNFKLNNMIFSSQNNGLVLNTQLLPPRPSDLTMLDSILVTIPDDSTYLTAAACDGAYIYFGNVIDRNFNRPSKIYKIGTGHLGTTRGQNYGPIGNLSIPIKNQIFYLDGFLYVATGDDSTLLRISPETADTQRIFIPDRLLPSEDGILSNGGFHVSTDGRYVYNLTAGYGTKRNKYILRTFDPQNNWIKIGDDVEFIGSSQPTFSNFFVSDGYVITIESFYNHYIRRYRIDGFFEEEWIVSQRPNIFYALAQDRTNNLVYISTYKPPMFAYQPAFFEFTGSYKNAFGIIESPEIGPAKQWQTLNFNIDSQGSTGSFNNVVLGKNIFSGLWDTLAVNVTPNYNLTNFSGNYNFIKTIFNFKDSSFGASEPLKFTNLGVDFIPYPEIHIHPSYLSFSEDTVMQGFDITMSLIIKNIGYSNYDSLLLNFSFNDEDSVVFSQNILSLQPDSIAIVQKTINTDNLLYTAPLTEIKLSANMQNSENEYYYFNNFTDKLFFISRDSISPRFHITFDGREILDGDIISSEPVVLISLEDNSPLPLDTTLFTIVHNNVPLRFSNPDLSFSYTPYPNSKAEITWTPKLNDGRHVLEVLAKDASNNFFDTTSYRQIFYVYNDPDLRQVYNYPNPFKDDTYFTFELRGINPPEEFKIKVFTIAGRLIREINIPPSSLQIGFNKIYWDGKDQDGDEIANGLYFYKIISKHGDEIKTITQKLAKVK